MRSSEHVMALLRFGASDTTHCTKPQIGLSFGCSNEHDGQGETTTGLIAILRGEGELVTARAYVDADPPGLRREVNRQEPKSGVTPLHAVLSRGQGTRAARLYEADDLAARESVRYPTTSSEDLCVLCPWVLQRTSLCVPRRGVQSNAPKRPHMPSRRN